MSDRKIIHGNGVEIVPDGNMICPFCNEKHFDSIGLKIHLTRGHCESFTNINLDNIKRVGRP